MRFIILLLMVTGQATLAQKVLEIDPNEVQMGPVIHETLPDALLKRIKSLTDTFEIVDGISYRQSVDLYKRDLDPESNIVIYEEMAKVYKSFCKSRCTDADERMDVYRLVLLRSMMSSEEAFVRAPLKVISEDEAKKILSEYNLAPQPIGVISE